MWDPLRHKEVADTPEERVRQGFIARLLELGVPQGLMGSEVPLKLGSKPFRADILIYDRSGKPLALVECKRPSVKITPIVAEQALRYHAALEVRFIMLTNGKIVYIYRREGAGFVSCERIPTYKEMLCQP